MPQDDVAHFVTDNESNLVTLAIAKRQQGMAHQD
jgi:hypothetical protein